MYMYLLVYNNTLVQFLKLILHKSYHWSRWRYCTLRTLAALQRLRLIIQTSLQGSYMRKSVLRVSIGVPLIPAPSV